MEFQVSLADRVIQDDAVHLVVQQGLEGQGVGVVSDHMLLAEIVFGQILTGGAGLHADGLLTEVLHGDVLAGLEDDGLLDGGVDIGEVEPDLAFFSLFAGGGHAGDDQVGLAELSAEQSGGEVHRDGFDSHAEFFADQGHDVRLDADHVVVVVAVFKGREVRAGGVSELAGFDGGEGGFGQGADEGQGEGQREDQSGQLFHGDSPFVSETLLKGPADGCQLFA